MQNPLVEMVERLSQIERYGIYIEDVNVEEKYKFDDEKKATLTGIPRPIGEYYIVHLNVMVAAHKPEDDGYTSVETKSSPTIQGIYAPVQDAIPACKHERFKRLNVAAPIIRGDIIFTKPYENTCKKAIKTETKYPDDIDKVVSAKPKTRKRKTK